MDKNHKRPNWHSKIEKYSILNNSLNKLIIWLNTEEEMMRASKTN